jgi:hypothetical protein
MRVSIIGGGFGGLTAAQSLRKADVEITLIASPLISNPITMGRPARFLCPSRFVPLVAFRCHAL